MANKNEKQYRSLRERINDEWRKHKIIQDALTGWKRPKAKRNEAYK